MKEYSNRMLLMEARPADTEVKQWWLEIYIQDTQISLDTMPHLPISEAQT
jgi:hypothetical protein